MQNPFIAYAIPHSYNTNTIEKSFDVILGSSHQQLSIDEKLKALGEFMHENDQYFDLEYRAPAPHIVPLETENVIQSYNTRIKDATKDADKKAIIARDGFQHANHTYHKKIEIDSKNGAKIYTI